VGVGSTLTACHRWRSGGSVARGGGSSWLIHWLFDLIFWYFVLVAAVF
jgi:hypothetical protein